MLTKARRSHKHTIIKQTCFLRKVSRRYQNICATSTHHLMSAAILTEQSGHCARSEEKDASLTADLNLRSSGPSVEEIPGLAASVASSSTTAANPSTVALSLTDSIGAKPSLTAVARFLMEHALGEYCDVMQNEGYDDVEDLVELLLHKELVERLVPKPGHRAKLSRLLSSAQQERRRGRLHAAEPSAPLQEQGCKDGSGSTLVGDTDDDSVADSVSVYSSATALQAHMRRQEVSASSFADPPSQPLYVDSSDAANCCSLSGVSLLRVQSYNDEFSSQPTSLPGMQQQRALSQQTVMLHNSLLPPPAAPTPSPSPQRSDDVSQQLLRPVFGVQQAGLARPVARTSRSPLRCQQGMRRSPSGHVCEGDDRLSVASFATVTNSSFLRQQAADESRHAGNALDAASLSGGPLITKMKIVVVGVPGCGKTSLIHRLVKNDFAPTSKPTIGVDFSEKKFQVGGAVVALHFWDIWGQESTVNATRTYYLGAKGAVVMYDACSEESLAKAVMWKKDLDAKAKCQTNGLPIPVLLVGNKYDLAGGKPALTSSGGILGSSSNLSSLQQRDRQLDPTAKTVLKSKVEIEAFCNEHRFSGHFFASAKTGENVRALAEYLVLAVLKMEPLEDEGHRDQRVVTLEGSARSIPGGSGVHRTPTRGSDRHQRSMSPKFPQKKLRCTML